MSQQIKDSLRKQKIGITQKLFAERGSVVVTCDGGVLVKSESGPWLLTS